MSKKVLSMILAVVMLFSVAVTAFAADSTLPEWVGIVVKSDAVIGQGAGTKVHVNVYLQFPEDFDNSGYKMQLSKFVLTFNGNKYAYVSDTWALKNLDGDKFLVEGNTRVMAPKQYKKMDFAETGENIYGWTTAVVLQQVIDNDSQDLDSGNSVNAATGYDVPIDGTDLALISSVTFNVTDTLTSNDVIGVSLASINSEKTSLSYKDGSFDSFYSASMIRVENAKPAPTVVANKAVQIQKTGNGVYSLGFVGTFCMDPDFADNGKSSAINSLGAEVWVDGVKVDGVHETNYAYVDSDNGGYKFRTVLTNVASTGADKVITVKLYAVLDDGSKVEAYETSTTLADQIARATAAGNGFVA